MEEKENKHIFAVAKEFTNNCFTKKSEAMKKMLFTCLLALMSLAGYAQREYICTGNNVNVRTGPGMNYPVQQAPGGNCGRGKIQLFKGERYTFTGERRNGFMKIEGTECWPTGYGWVSAQYLRPADNGSFQSAQSLTALERKVVGRHMLSLQWISWEYFGVCEIVKEGDGGLRCTGIQKSKENDDYLHIDGYIQIVSATHLIFTGSIEYKVYHLNGGEPYEKTGTFNFKATNGRKYWRAQEMEGADGVTDYVDIYFK